MKSKTFLIVCCVIFIFPCWIFPETFKKAYEITQTAQKLLQDKQYAKAEKKLKRVIKISPNFFYAYNVLAAGYTAQGGRENEAITALKKSLELKDAQPKVYCSLGELYNALLMPEEAIVYFKKGLTYAPNNFQMNYVLGVTYFLGLHDLENALSYIEIAHNIAPKNTKLLYINGVLNIYASHFPKVLEYITILRDLGDEKSANALELAIKERKPIMVSEQDVSVAGNSSNNSGREKTIDADGGSTVAEGAQISVNPENIAQSSKTERIEVNNPTQKMSGSGKVTLETKFKKN